MQVDLFHAPGPPPANLEQAAEREKDIRDSSRTHAGTEAFRVKHDVRHNINALHELLPESLRKTPQARWLYAVSCVTTMDIVQLIYQPPEMQGPGKDDDFSREAMQRRWAQGYADANATLLASPWLAPVPPDVGCASSKSSTTRARRRANRRARLSSNTLTQLRASTTSGPRRTADQSRNCTLKETQGRPKFP